MVSGNSLEERFHAAAEEQIERVVLETAMEQTGARYGALFVWDASAKALRLDFRVVDGVVVDGPRALAASSKGWAP